MCNSSFEGQDKHRLTLKELPESERPYEKCEEYGPEVLSDAELLAVIIRTGSRNKRATETACQILGLSDGYGGNLGVLYHLDTESLKAIPGIGRVKALQLLCIAELSKRINKAERARSVSFQCAEDVFLYYKEDIRHLEREVIMAAFLDSRNMLLSEKIIFTGTVHGAYANPREILIEALKARAVSFVLLHNHPSGNAEPSMADMTSTRRLFEAAQTVGITLSDHIIVGGNTYYSFKENKLM